MCSIIIKFIRRRHGIHIYVHLFNGSRFQVRWRLYEEHTKENKLIPSLYRDQRYPWTDYEPTDQKDVVVIRTLLPSPPSEESGMTHVESKDIMLLISLSCHCSPLHYHCSSLLPYAYISYLFIWIQSTLFLPLFHYIFCIIDKGCNQRYIHTPSLCYPYTHTYSIHNHSFFFFFSDFDFSFLWLYIFLILFMTSIAGMSWIFFKFMVYIGSI